MGEWWDVNAEEALTVGKLIELLKEYPLDTKVYAAAEGIEALLAAISSKTRAREGSSWRYQFSKEEEPPPFVVLVADSQFLPEEVEG